MTLQGTVIHGVIVPNAKAQLPEGARVWIELAEDGDNLFHRRSHMTGKRNG